jgi:hypothetical protein
MLTIAASWAAPGCRAGWPAASSPSARDPLGLRDHGGDLLNLALNLLFEPHAWWALLPMALFAFGWALMVPVVTLMVLDLRPTGAAWPVVAAGLRGQRWPTAWWPA